MTPWCRILNEFGHVRHDLDVKAASEEPQPPPITFVETEMSTLHRHRCSKPTATAELPRQVIFSVMWPLVTEVGPDALDSHGHL